MPPRYRGAVAELSTERLLLRPWRAADRAPFAALNADPEVMRHFPAPLTREQSDAFADRIEASFAHQGWGLWAVEVRDGGEFIGFTGLARPSFDAHFTPAIEIGWRLARGAWGRGYATEAARAAAAFGFETLAAEELVSFTAVANTRSRAVMERLGMTHDASGDFDLPSVPAGHELRRHVLYRLRGGAVSAAGQRVTRTER
jgi:RimJ/RimL family protein N-acetyltransferase